MQETVCVHVHSCTSDKKRREKKEKCLEQSTRFYHSMQNKGEIRKLSEKECKELQIEDCKEVDYSAAECMSEAEEDPSVRSARMAMTAEKSC